MTPRVESPISRFKPRGRSRKAGKVINRLLGHRLISHLSDEEYREEVRHVYDGPQGAILATCSFISLHTVLGERLLRERKFDLRGAKRILDVGSGAGQIARHLLKYADGDAQLTCFDLSHETMRPICRSPTPPSIASPAATCWSTFPTCGGDWPRSAG